MPNSIFFIDKCRLVKNFIEIEGAKKTLWIPLRNSVVSNPFFNTEATQSITEKRESGISRKNSFS